MLIVICNYINKSICVKLFYTFDVVQGST